MADLKFSQSQRRNLALPILIALLVLGAAAALIVHLLPSRDAELKVTHIAIWHARTVFKADSIVVGQDSAQDDLYVFATVHIDNHLHIPIFLKDFTGTVTTSNGQLLSTSAVEKGDLPNLYQAFPALKSLSTVPLLRETSITAGRSAEGMVLLHFPITEEDWKHRQSATLTTDFYHQSPQTIAIPASQP